MLRSFPQDDRDDMVEDGKITVTCEFCSSTYVFPPQEVAAVRPALTAGGLRAQSLQIDRLAL